MGVIIVLVPIYSVGSNSYGALTLRRVYRYDLLFVVRSVANRGLNILHSVTRLSVCRLRWRCNFIFTSCIQLK